MKVINLEVKNMMPTKTAVNIAMASDIHKLFDNIQTWQEGLGAFQRVCLVADYDTAMRCLAPYISAKIDPQQKQALQLIHTLAKSDVLGLAMEGLVHIIQTSKNDRDKLEAARVLNDLYGEKKLDNDLGLSEKLSINLV